MRVIGQFTDLDRPDHFVWLRGFADMAARRAGLESFYAGAGLGGAPQRRQRDHDRRQRRPPAALRPADLVAGDAGARRGRARTAASRPPSTVYLLDICTLRAPVDAAWRRAFEREVLPLLVELRRDALRGARDRAGGERLSAPAGAQRRERVRLALAPCRRRRGDARRRAPGALGALERGRAAAPARRLGGADAAVAAAPDGAVAAALRRDRACRRP